MMNQIPEKPSLENLEEKWNNIWEESGIYKFPNKSSDQWPKSRKDVYSIDTPPPTVSGSLHVGHVFSYTQTDVIARYKRMTKKTIYYPIGWDDNGLATERRVQNYYGVTCDPDLAYDENFVAPDIANGDKPFDPMKPLSRRNFIELCDTLVAIDEEKFEEVWRKVGLSVDWSKTYTTIGKDAQFVSQASFLDLLKDGKAYKSQAPTMWDVTFQTAVAQAEIEDRELAGEFFKVKFYLADGEKFEGKEYIEIETTRPELIAADIAIAVNPKDERYTSLHGKFALSPLYNIRLPILTHELADPQKGSGAVMVSSWGDITDVTWWRELRHEGKTLPTRCILQRNGRIVEEYPKDWELFSENLDFAKECFSEIIGKNAKQAKKIVVEQLKENDLLIGEPKQIIRPVKYYEKGDLPLEIVSSSQWYFTNGALDESLRNDLVLQGQKLNWVPKYMNHRLTNWIEGLNGDWLISRQRFFGVPFPVWYKIDSNGEPIWDDPILPTEDMLPIDPSSQTPTDYNESQRNQPNGFMSDPDVMDTWATSSLTPQIVCGYKTDNDLYDVTYPMDLRPQAHEIIRTWLFSSLLRAYFIDGQLPWKNASIAGWILDPDRKKMSKSKGNVVVPLDLLEKFGSDGVRYWALGAKPGADTLFDEGQMKIGRRLATKILNASKFVSIVCGEISSISKDKITNVLDQSYISKIDECIELATKAFEVYDYAKALEIIEENFWDFCDNYLELVKSRAYSGDESSRVALTTILDTFQKLLAPYLPFVCEEVYSWKNDDSVHIQEWPKQIGSIVDVSLYNIVSQVVTQVRAIKTTNQVSLKAEVVECSIFSTISDQELIKSSIEDIKLTGNISNIVFFEEDELRVDVKLA